MSFSGRLIGLHPVIENSEMLSEEPCIYVCNHQSCIDVASAAGVWPKRCTVVSKASLRLAGPMGIVMWLSNTICINRSSHKDAISAMQKASAAAKRDHVSVFIFPEGTRSDNDNLLPFKKGAFHMAIQCQFPIQPIVIEPYKRFLDHKNKVFEGGSTSVFVQWLVSWICVISTTSASQTQIEPLAGLGGSFVVQRLVKLPGFLRYVSLCQETLNHYAPSFTSVRQLLIADDAKELSILITCMGSLPPATYRVRVLPRIETKGMNESQVDELLNETRAKMVEAFESMKVSTF